MTVPKPLPQNFPRIDRYAEQEWVSSSKAPPEPMWTSVKSARAGAAAKRVLFNGRYWMTREAIDYWKPVPPEEQPISALMETPRGITPIEGLEVVELDELPPGHEALALAELARLELEVEVVRVFRAAEGAEGAASGRVLAVSERFAAQALGNDGVLIHEQAALQRQVAAGEHVTIDYQAGRGTVYNGIFYDVNIRSPFLTKDQVGWMRMHMINALSASPKAYQDSDLIKEALRYALDRTVEAFMLERERITKTQIQLSVNDTFTPQLEEKADEAVDRARSAAAADEARQAASRAVLARGG